MFNQLENQETQSGILTLSSLSIATMVLTNNGGCQYVVFGCKVTKKTPYKQTTMTFLCDIFLGHKP